MKKIDPAFAALLRCSPIKIGADYFRLKVVSGKDWHEGDDYIGLISYRDGEMRFHDKARGYVLIDALFHECLHGIWNNHLANILDQWTLSSRMPVTPPLGNIEEAVVGVYETGLAALFLDNPRLLKLFTYYWQPSTRKRKD